MCWCCSEDKAMAEVRLHFHVRPIIGDNQEILSGASVMICPACLRAGCHLAGKPGCATAAAKRAEQAKMAEADADARAALVAKANAEIAERDAIRASRLGTYAPPAPAAESRRGRKAPEAAPVKQEV